MLAQRAGVLRRVHGVKAQRASEAKRAGRPFSPLESGLNRGNRVIHGHETDLGPIAVLRRCTAANLRLEVSPSKDDRAVPYGDFNECQITI